MDVNDTSNGTEAPSCAYTIPGDAIAAIAPADSGQKPPPLSSDAQLFQDRFDELVAELTTKGEDADIDDDPSGALAGALARLRDVLAYNAPGGKRQRGLAVIGTLRRLVPGRQLPPDAVRQALTVGWCVELLQAFFLVADDVMDGSSTRRGRPCWHRVDGVGLDAVNDAFLLEHVAYRLLRRHCGGRPYYARLLELFTETTYRTALGQAMDLAAARSRDPVRDFTAERHAAIARHKTALYSFYLPVAAAMLMAGVYGAAEHAAARRIALELGELFQAQDDYLDVYGDPAVTGKVGSDIRDNKCSWLVVAALKAARTPEQRAELAACYGRGDGDGDEEECEERVKRLYDELGMPALYRCHEDESYRRLRELVARHAGHLPHDVFLDFAEKIYKRNK